jgi:hypothetical protein
LWSSNFPAGSSKSAATYQGAVQLPALCGSKADNIHLQQGATFTSLLSATDTTDKVQVQWHYVDTGAGKKANSSINCADLAQNLDPGLAICNGGWSGTLSTVPGTAASSISFQCQLDGGGFSPCGTGATGTKTYPGPLSAGNHTFQVEAVVAGTPSAPASFTWTILKNSPTLSLTGPGSPGAGTAGTPVPASSITATLAGAFTPATGSVTFMVFGPSASPCTSGGTTIGAAPVSGNTSYHPNADFTPKAAGNYWLYASYPGDTNNNSAASACPPGAAQKIVVANAVGKASPALTVSAPGSLSAGGSVTTADLTASLLGSSGSNATSTITFTVIGPQASPPANCTSGGTTVGTATPAGDGTYHSSAGFTPDAAGTYWWYVSSPADANNTAAASTCNDASMTKTVVANPTQQLATSGDAVGVIYPGGPAQPIAITFNNPNSAAVDVTGLTVAVGSTGVAGCSASDFQITQSNITASNRFTVPANSSVTIPSSGPVSRPTIRMVDNGNQTACAGAHLTLNYSSS